MGKTATVFLDQSIQDEVRGAGTSYMVQTVANELYHIFINNLSDVAFRKSTDGGITWSASTTVFIGTTVNLAVWYDRWSNIAAGLIHCVYTDSGIDDTLYRTINTESSDALSTETTIFAGLSTASGGHLSVTRAVGGNVYCKTVIDAGAEGGFFRLPNANVPNGAWDAARTVDEAIASGDQMILLPDYDAADTQDIMAIFFDTSASEISRKLYDDSANSWAETSIATSMSLPAATTAWPCMAVAPDIGNTRHILVAWSGVDTANADLRCWTVDSGAITETSTNVVLNSTDDQGLCGITLDVGTGYWYVFYCGKSDGSETWTTLLNVYYKCSRDSGATWGAETAITTTTKPRIGLRVVPRLVNSIAVPPPCVTYVTTTPDLQVSATMAFPAAKVMIGL